MATQYQQPGQLPEGVVLQHTLYGEPDRTVTHAWTATGAGGVELVPAPDQGIEYEDAPMSASPEPEPEPQPEPEPAPVEPFSEHEQRVAQLIVVSDDALLPITPRPEPEVVIVRPADPRDPTEPESERAKRCKAKNDTCRGWRIKGSDYCAAHSGLLNPSARVR